MREAVTLSIRAKKRSTGRGNLGPFQRLLGPLHLCSDCEKHTSSPTKLSPPQVAADVFQLEDLPYLADGDRLTGYLELARFPSDSGSGRFITKWGAREITDGGTNLASKEMPAFFKTWEGQGAAVFGVHPV